MKFSIFLVLLTCLVMVSPTQKYEESYYQKHFLKFIDKFNKNYDGINIIVKYNNFKENLDKIELTNINNHHALHDINEHADLTDEEFN